jgi:hypothetical protein
MFIRPSIGAVGGGDRPIGAGEVDFDGLGLGRLGDRRRERRRIDGFAAGRAQRQDQDQGEQEAVDEHGERAQAQENA